MTPQAPVGSLRQSRAESSQCERCLSKFIIIVFLDALGLHCFTQAVSSCGKWGSSLVALSGFLRAAASLVEEHQL